MKAALALLLGLLALPALRADDFLDTLDQSLSTSAFNDAFRARLSGSVDLEGYDMTQPGPGLILSDKSTLFNPRLTLFLDAQVGSQFYVFVESRADHGFDPGDGKGQISLDEYALRFTPWHRGYLNIQVGKFATVVGNWVPRHESWDNPLITAPLPYEDLTGIWDVMAATHTVEILNWAGLHPATSGAVIDYDRSVPIIWGPSYATGAAISGDLGQLNYAFEVKNASLSSRPEVWDYSKTQFDHPTLSGRIGYCPSEEWSVGASASSGSYLMQTASPTVPIGSSLSDYREILFGQDAAYAWHYFQLWAELYEARFQIPRVGNADTFSYYLESKLKLTPQLFVALRWNQQLFATLPDPAGGMDRWGRNVWRIDAGPGFRFSAHIQFKLQESVQHEDQSAQEYENLLAGQLTVKF